MVMNLIDKRKIVGWLEDHIEKLKKCRNAGTPEAQASIARLKESKDKFVKEIAIQESKNARKNNYDGSSEHGWGD